MSEEKIKNLFEELMEGGASRQEAEELSLLSKNVSNLYEFKRSDLLKYKFLSANRKRFYFPSRFFLTAAFSVLLLLGFASVVAAQKSLPGDLLYPVKIASEKFASSIDPSFKGEILERRSEEIKGVSSENSSGKLHKAVEDYERTLNEDGGISQESIRSSRRNLEQAHESSLEENKKEIEKAILDTRNRERELEEDVKGDSTDSSRGNGENESGIGGNGGNNEVKPPNLLDNK